MSKVIVERPRVGSRNRSRKKGYRKYVSSCPLDELPNREPMLGRWKGREKWLNEHLAPMRRFLRSNVGRPWNKIHQEICEHINVNSAVQMHILEHIDDYVNKHVEICGHKIYRINGWWSRWLRPGEMYVCPTTGILKLVKKFETQQHSTHLRIDSKQLLKRAGHWWEIQLQKFPDVVGEQFDAWLEVPLSKLSIDDCYREYHDKAFAVSKRLLSNAEFKRLKSKDDKERKRQQRKRKSR